MSSPGLNLWTAGGAGPWFSGSTREPEQVTKDTKRENIRKIGRLLSDLVVAGSWSGVSLHIVSVSNMFNELFLFLFVVEKHFKSFKSILKTPSSRPLSSFFFVLPLRRTRRLNAWPRAHTQKKPRLQCNNRSNFSIRISPTTISCNAL